MLRPERPIFRSSLSIKKATLAIYPLSSIMDRKKNSVTNNGREGKHENYSGKDTVNHKAVKNRIYMSCL